MATQTTSRTGTTPPKSAIHEDGPGTVLRDFDALLEFVGVEGVRTTSKHYLLPIERLFELDEQMTRPLRPKLQRPQQPSFPHIHGLYLLLRAAFFAVDSGKGKKDGRVSVDPRMLEQWQALNPTERYFNLLEAWMLWATPEMIGERGGVPKWNRGMLYDAEILWHHVSAKGRTFKPRDRIVILPIIRPRQFYQLALFELFGLLEIQSGKPAESENWSIRSVSRTPFGNLIFDGITQDRRSIRGPMDHLPIPDANAAVDDDELLEGDELCFGVWQPLFADLFPEWQNNLEIAPAESTDGVFCFRVSLGRPWRRIAIPSDCKLDDLAWTIFDAYDFDGDHLYDFKFRGRDGATVEVGRAEGSDYHAFTDEFDIGELPLSEGQSMRLTYDYGANWQFDVKLERIDPPDKKLKGPMIVESRGKAPEEYPDYDEDW